MPKPGQQITPGRRKIVHQITKHIRDRYPRVVENDDIAEALGLRREQVRNSIRQYMAQHPGEFVEDGPYRYVAVSPHAGPTAPVSAPPATVNHIVNVGSGDAPTFRFLMVVADSEVLLQDADKNVWKATLL